MELVVNGGSYSLETPVGRSLAETLRDSLGLTGTKIGCNEGHCGACTVLVNGVPTLSCITLVHTVEGRDVTTIEGLRDHPLVDSFVRSDALQCGFCTPGQIVSASALVEANPEPTREQYVPIWPQPVPLRAYPKIEEALSLARLINKRRGRGRYEDLWSWSEAARPLAAGPASRRPSTPRIRAPYVPAARPSKRRASSSRSLAHCVLPSPCR